MPSLQQLLLITPYLLVVAYGQGVIISAQGTKGSPASLPLQVDLTKADANIINAQELNQNVVNECGRTLLAGNIDIGQNTEDQLLNKTVTSVTKGGNVAVTIRQGDANGAGPYSCDIDLTSNADGISGQTNLTVKETDGANGDINLSLTMPSDMKCVGASTGNICTVRCFNQAAAGPFGGCFAVQQTDVTANKNTPGTIVTAQTLAGVNAQIAQNQIDLPAALKANAEATTGTEAEQGRLSADEILGIDSTASATVNIGAAATSTAAAAKGTKASTGKGKGNANGATAKGAAGTTTAKGATGATTGKNGNAAKNNRRRATRVFVS
ncbi:hypothetical protein BGZ60DRAFT_378823 [Tricladium varicosporioides]|nr:hypothetical protein BGZ60DRAFT_378823 [Hymenoscyphus varicosporioides]